MLDVDQIRRQISDGTVPNTRPRPNGCKFYVKTEFRKSYPEILTNAKTVGHLLSDGNRMIKDQTDSGARYFLVIVYQYSRYVHAVQMVDKSEVSAIVLMFVTWFDRRTGKHIK